MSVQDFIEKRQAGFLAAWNGCSVEGLEKYIAEDVDYSDLGKLLNFSKTGFFTLHNS